MTGTKLNNNFNLAQRKPLDERQTTVATVAELSLIRYPYPNLRVYVGGTIRKWYEYRLFLGTMQWRADGSDFTVSYNDLNDRPTINGRELHQGSTLDELDIQPKGNYLPDTALDNYYDKDSTFSKNEIVLSYATKDDISNKVDKVIDHRLISDTELNKLASDITPLQLTNKENELKSILVRKNTSELIVAPSFNGESKEYIRLYNETTEKEYKIKLATLFNSASSVLEAKRLTRDKETENFICPKYLLGTSSVYVNGVKYFRGQGYQEVNDTSIAFNSYIPELSNDTLMIEAVWVIR